MPEQSKDHLHDFSRFDSYSTEALEAILQADAQQPNNDANLDAILYITEVLERRAKENNEYSFDTEAKKREFDRFYLPYLQDASPLSGEDGEQDATAESGQPRRRAGRRSLPTLLRTACVAAAVIAILFALSLAASAAMGTNLWGLFADWTDGAFSFGNTTERTTREPEAGAANVDPDRVFSSLQEMLDAYGVTEVKAPEGIPEKYVLTELETGAFSAGPWFYASYIYNYKEYDEELISVYYQSYDTEPGVVYEKTDDPVEIDCIGTTILYTFRNTNSRTVAWVTEHFECSICAPLSVEELKDIAISAINEGN